MTSQNWIPKRKQIVPQIIQNEIPNPLVQQRLSIFGLTTKESVSAFLDPENYLPAAPEELPDMEKAVTRLWEALQNQEKIGVWGDFDVDGQTSTTLLVDGLRKLNGKVVHHIPHRQKESHGIKLGFLKEFLNEGIELLLTCDTGVSEHESIHYAQENGLDVIITDHHSLPEQLPPAFAIVNPQRLDKDHPMRHLAGVGTAYKLIEALYIRAARGDECQQFLDLVALGTVADVALLLGENRYLVQLGLKQMQNNPRPSLKEIYDLKGIPAQDINESHISFTFAPMLNALGRLDDANPIVNFLTTTNNQQIKTFASRLNNLNEKRKLLTEQITEAVFDKIERNPEINQKAALVIQQDYWHSGILGIVANRIVESFQKPVLLLTGNQEEGYSGSARSVESVNIIQAIREQGHLLTHYGGHAMAAGVSMPAENLDEFVRGLDKSIKEQTKEDPGELQLQYDLQLTLEQITTDFIESFLPLRPFGAGNPQLVFYAENVKINKATGIGQNQVHTKLNVSDENDHTIDILWWRGDRDTLPENNIDLLFTLNQSTFRGEKQTQVELITYRPTVKINAVAIKTKNSCQILDWRNKPKPLEEISLTYPQAAIWSEGTSGAKIVSYNRLDLPPAAYLAICFIPPGLKEIKKILRTSLPEVLILNPINKTDNQLNTIIPLIGKMINYAIKHKNGLINFQKMAAVIGQRSKTVETIVEWYAAAGQISIIRHPDTDPYVKAGGNPDDEMKLYLKNQIQFLLKETTAFQNWFVSANPDTLKEDLLYFD